jgi:hypothetical protein
MVKKAKGEMIIFNLAMTKKQIDMTNDVIECNKKSKHFFIIANVNPSEGLLKCCMITEKDASDLKKGVKLMKRNSVEKVAVLKRYKHGI